MNCNNTAAIMYKRIKQYKLAKLYIKLYKMFNERQDSFL